MRSNRKDASEVRICDGPATNIQPSFRGVDISTSDIRLIQLFTEILYVASGEERKALGKSRKPLILLPTTETC